MLLFQLPNDSLCAEDAHDCWSCSDQEPCLMPFCGSPGLKPTTSDESLPDLRDPIDFFNLLFEDSMFDTLEAESNHYASSRIEGADLGGS